MGVEYNLPFGYEMMQDPETVAAIMADVARLMARNCELSTENERLADEVEYLKGVICWQRRLLYGKK